MVLREKEMLDFAKEMHLMFSINSRTCDEGTLTAFAWLEVFHVYRSGVVLIYGGLDTKLIVRQTDQKYITLDYFSWPSPSCP